MRILLVPAIVALAALASSGAAAPDVPARVVSPPPSKCPPVQRNAVGPDGSRIWRSTEAPTVDLHLAVDRRENGCPVAVIIRRDVDGRGPSRSGNAIHRN